MRPFTKKAKIKEKEAGWPPSISDGGKTESYLTFTSSSGAHGKSYIHVRPTSSAMSRPARLLDGWTQSPLKVQVVSVIICSSSTSRSSLPMVCPRFHEKKNILVVPKRTPVAPPPPAHLNLITTSVSDTLTQRQDAGVLIPFLKNSKFLQSSSECVSPHNIFQTNCSLRVHIHVKVGRWVVPSGFSHHC